jgi:hypothetical protein
MWAIVMGSGEVRQCRECSVERRREKGGDAVQEVQCIETTGEER